MKALEANIFDHHEHEALEAEAYLKGEARGLASGMEKGLAQGMAQGMVQGMEKEREKLTVFFRSKGVSKEIIAEALVLK